MTPFSTVGKTSVTVPSRSTSLTRTTAGMPVRSRPAWTSDTVAVDAERREVGDARDDVAAAHQRALLRQHPRQHAVAIRLRRREIEQPARLRGFLVERAALERQPLELHRRWRARRSSRSSRSCASSICACFTASSERRSASRESRPSLNSCWSPSSRACADCSSSVLTSSRAVEIDQRFLERQPRLRLLVVLDLQVLDDLLERQHRFADVELDDRIAPLQAARPAAARMRSTRASSGLESTRSTSGTTVPVAMITASIGPLVTLRRADPRRG